MFARSIVESLNAVRNIFRCVRTVFVDVLLDEFLLQTAEKRFRHGIVPTVAFATHAGFKVAQPTCVFSRVTATRSPSNCTSDSGVKSASGSSSNPATIPIQTRSVAQKQTRHAGGLIADYLDDVNRLKTSCYAAYAWNPLSIRSGVCH